MLIAVLITVDVPYIFMRLSTSMPVHVQMQYTTSRLTNYKHWKHTTSTNLVTREWSNLWLMGCTMSAPSTPASSKDCSGAKQNSTSYPVITWKLLKKRCLGWEQFFFICITRKLLKKKVFRLGAVFLYMYYMNWFEFEIQDYRHEHLTSKIDR